MKIWKTLVKEFIFQNRKNLLYLFFDKKSTLCAYLRNEQKLERIEELWPHLKLKNNGGLNSKTLSNSSSLKRKTHFLIFLAIFKGHLVSIILISEKNPYVKHFIYINSLIWLHSHPLSKISTNPNTLLKMQTVN